MHKSYRQAALDNIDSAMEDASLYCSVWHDEGEFTYGLADVIAMAKLILEEEQRDRERERS